MIIALVGAKRLDESKRFCGSVGCVFVECVFVTGTLQTLVVSANAYDQQTGGSVELTFHEIYCFILISPIRVYLTLIGVISPYLLGI